MSRSISSWYQFIDAFRAAVPEQDVDQIQTIRQHDLRHTFCSMLYDSNVDVKTAQKLMGHSTPDITMKIYTHLSKEKEAISVANISKFLDELNADK